MHICPDLYVVVAVLGEEQELDRSPLRKRLALGPPASGLSGVWDGGPRKPIGSPPSPPSPPSPAVLLHLRPTSIRQESSEGEESSGMSTISDINREPLSMDTKEIKSCIFIITGKLLETYSTV